MKKGIKYFLYALIPACIVVSTLFAFQGKPEKVYTFKFNQQQVEAVWYVLDNSTASHNDVKLVQKWLSEQYGAQLDTTTSKKK